MLNLVNWWFPYSVSQIESAISVGYHVHVVFTKGESRLDVLEFLARKHRGKLFYSFDTTPRYSKAAHTLTRFDYLPDILVEYGTDVLVTDADVIHERRLAALPKSSDMVLWRIRPRPVREIDANAKQHGFPVWWSELANQTMAEAMAVSPTEHGIAFAEDVRRYADALREDGYGDRWGIDQVAIHIAEQRRPDAEVHLLNVGSRDVGTYPGWTVWYPHPHERENSRSPWRLRVDGYWRNVQAEMRHDQS